MSWKYWRHNKGDYEADSLTLELLLLPTIFECEHINLEEVVQELNSLSRERRMLVGNCVTVIRLILTAVLLSQHLGGPSQCWEELKHGCHQEWHWKDLIPNPFFVTTSPFIMIYYYFMQKTNLWNIIQIEWTLLVILQRNICRSLYIFCF